MLPWARVWTRAVIVPASRRASAAWVGCAIVAAVSFGPTAMQPRDLTGLALRAPGVLAVLAITWILVFAPTARLLLRADSASYLRSLPAPRWISIALAAAALVGLQLPWLALWLAGEGLRGLVVFAATTLLVLGLAAWRPPSVRAGWPVWRGAGRALCAVHLRALRRRAGDALVRGAGLSLLAGGAAGLFVRNNDLHGADAAVMGASVIAIAAVPAHVGVSMVIAGAHRETAWLAATLGMRRTTRTLALVFAFALVHLGSAMLAIGAALALIEPTAHRIDTAAWLGATTLGIAVGTAIGAARVVLGAEASPTLAGRTVASAIAVAAAAVLALGLFGVAGVAALIASALLALAIGNRADEGRA